MLADGPSAEEILAWSEPELTDREQVDERIQSEYWAAGPLRSKEVATAIIERFENHLNHMNNSPVGTVLWQAYCTHHMLNPESDYDASPASRVRFGGEHDEIVLTDIAHYRTLIKHKKNLVTGDRLNFTPEAGTSDGDAMEQVTVARHVIDYALDQKQLEKGLRDCQEIALYLGAGFVVLEWDPYQGTPIGKKDPTTGIVPMSGDMDWCVLSPYDVTHEPVRDYRACRWHVVRRFKNKFDLAARLRDRGDHQTALRLLEQSYRDTDYLYTMPASEDSFGGESIPTYTLYHDRTPSMPKGRMMEVTGDGLVIDDRGLPYPRALVYRMCPSTFGGTSIPFADSWTWLPLHEMANAVMSPMLSRIDAFGHPIVNVPEGGDWSPQDFGPYRVHESPTGTDAPSLIDFSAFPPTMPTFYGLIKAELESISGINSVVQGRPAENISSGSMAVLVHSQALEFVTDDVEQFVFVSESTVMGVIQLYQSRATESMLITISGKEGEAGVKAFRGDAIKTIKRVKAKRADPAMRTTAAKEQAANVLLANGLLRSPQEYLAMVSTGTYDSIFTDDVRMMALIREENAILLKGGNVHVAEVEPFHLHIPEHMALLDMYAKSHPEIETAIKKHIAATMKQWKELSMTRPDLLQAMGVPVLPPSPQMQQQMAEAGMAPGAPQQGPKPKGKPGPKAAETPGVDNKAVKAKEPGMPSMPGMPGA